MNTNIGMISRVAIAAALIAGAQAAKAADPAPAPASPAGVSADDEVIVTGTRSVGITAAESAAPIKLLGAEAIEHVGQPNLNQVLTQLIPSFNAAAFGGDTAQLTLSARLRGLSPNHTLVLVNGKRRHGTANLAVLSGVSQGGAAPDLDFITPSSIKRIEVLEDGAAAQYGSDAIAGVINIILKDSDNGGSASATAGQYYKSDGKIVSGNVNLGTKLGEGGFINLTGMYRYHQRSQVGGIDRRVYLPDGTVRSTATGLSPQQVALYQNLPGAPYVNRIFGDPQSKLAQGGFNAGYDFGDVQLYSFGTYSHRTAAAYENYRVPDRVRYSPVLGVQGSLTTPGEVLFNPLGFNPQEAFREDDAAITGGAKGDLAGFHWDVSATYGRDQDKIYTKNSANAALYVDTHFTPTTMYDGKFINDELTLNADFSKEIDVGLAGPLNVAFGAEYRKNGYTIGSGDPASIYKEGGQSYPGFQPTDAGHHTRKNESAYIDIALNPFEGLKLDAAGRYEHYSDFGSEVIGKLTARYDFTPEVAIRGTISNGFRAPTLAEEFYSATNVSPTSATVQLPANSAAAKLIGFDNLRPEKSFNISAGAVFRPIDRATLTIDYYHIRIKDRVVGSGTLFGLGGATNDPRVLLAIAAHGNVLDPTVTQVGVAAFTNGLNTNTNGVDVVGSYMIPSDYGSFNLTLSGNYNDIKISKIDPVAATLLDRTSTSTLEHSSPKFKVIGGLNWSLDRFSLTARETLYGKSYILYSPNGGTYYKNQVKTAAITDLEVGVDLTKSLKFSVGSNNLFNKKPSKVVAVPGSGPVLTLSTAGNVYDAPNTFSAYGINGGYYYARIDFSF
ncbi:TonB-dependent receptor plug domain-containing protein [Sphingomonas crusticola]|uniref:TonB-dependent receptor plug domain-containing protein n=1 Tax=Sphingomonas crusticola TaxID=1697973 RepID=UPI001F0750BB|nr:TonB-dependent receptor [Sphingomonas crusticola]